MSPPQSANHPPTDDGAAPPPLTARVQADVSAGDFPLVVSFDATSSDLGPDGEVRYEWDFGDGVVGDGASQVEHTYIGEGTFAATLTVVKAGTNVASQAEVTIEVSRPECPSEEEVVEWGHLDDHRLDNVSGLVSSRLEPDVYWVHEDRRGRAELTAIDSWGTTLGAYELEDHLVDFEDIVAAIDPDTGESTLYLGDIGDNLRNRNEIAVWVIEEPDPYDDGELEPMRMALTYPDQPHNAETLLVDPLTLDLYIVTKESWGDASVYVKRAPHDDEGPFELDRLGSPWTLEMMATGGDVSPNGAWIVVRDYSTTAKLFIRDGYEDFDEAFDESPCRIDIAWEAQGEAIGFTSDGAGVVTMSEGASPALHFVGL